MADQYSVFNPTVDLNPYATQIAEIQRRKRMAELLQQQGTDPLESQVVGGRVIPISPWQMLAKGLQAGFGAYQSRKADQAAAELQDRMAEEQRTREAEVESAGKAIAGRMFGERDQYTKEGLPVAAGPTVREAPTSGDQLGEITPTARYQYDPQSAFQMAMTPAGREAMKGNPALAAALANMVKPKELEIAGINVSDFTPESIQKAKASGDYSQLQRIPTAAKSEATPASIREYEYAVAQGYKGSYQQWSESQKRAGATTVYGTSAQTGVDAQGNPVFFQTSPQGGAPSIVQGVRPKTEVTGEAAVDKRQYREKRTSLQNAMDVVAKFETALANIPKGESLIGEKAGELSSSYKLALGAIRELQNTGVLNPGELPFIEATLRDPQSLSQLLNPQSRNAIAGQLNQIKSTLQSRASTLDDSYGYDVRPLKMPEKTGSVSAVAPAIGTVKNGYRFKGGNPADPKNWEKQ